MKISIMMKVIKYSLFLGYNLSLNDNTWRGNEICYKSIQ